MRRIDRHLWFASFCMFIVVAQVASGAPPGAPEEGRYDALRAHSPFSLATVAPPPTAPPTSFAANWFVSGIGRIGDSDFVTIKSRDLAIAFSLYGREEDPVTKVALASVNWSDSVGKSTVILRKGTETARLEFSEADLRGSAANPTATPATAAAANPTVPAPPFASHATAGGVAAVAPNAASSIRRRTVPIQPPR